MACLNQIDVIRKSPRDKKICFVSYPDGKSRDLHLDTGATVIYTGSTDNVSIKVFLHRIEA